MLLQDKVLIIYDPEMPLVIARGSSSYDLGAVLSHRTLQGKERTILYATRSLSEIEEKYSQIEKESLSLDWGVKKFQTYLEGRNFTLVTDQQPLKYIMDPERAVSVMAAARIQRWCLFLDAFHTALSCEVQHSRPTVIVSLVFHKHRTGWQARWRGNDSYICDQGLTCHRTRDEKADP